MPRRKYLRGPSRRDTKSQKQFTNSTKRGVIVLLIFVNGILFICNHRNNVFILHFIKHET